MNLGGCWIYDTQIFRSPKKDNTATLGEAFDEVDSLFLMQRPQSPDEVPTAAITINQEGSSAPSTAPEGTAAISSWGSLPPPVTPGLNNDFDRIMTWGRVRNLVTSYARRAPDRPQPIASLRVHLLYEQQGITESADVPCPTWLLQEEQPIHHFCEWRQALCFDFTDESTRAFPVLQELIQNTPSFLVAQELWPGQMPIVVVLTDQLSPMYYVYHSYQFERVAGIIDWLQRHVELMLPYTITFRGHRIDSGQDIPVTAGEVLFVTSQTWQENQNPLPVTAEPELSIDFATHSTWENTLTQETFESHQDHGYADDATLEPQRQLYCQPSEPRQPGENTATLDDGEHFEGDDFNLYQIYEICTQQVEVEGDDEIVLRDNTATLFTNEEIERSYYREDWRSYQRWRHAVRLARSRTDTTGIETLLNEAVAYHRSRGAWPEFVLFCFPDAWYRGVPDPQMSLDVDNFILYAREFFQAIRQDQMILLVAVNPPLSPREQQYEEALHMMVDTEPSGGSVLAMVVEDHENYDELQLWPLKVKASVRTLDILRAVGRIEERRQPHKSCRMYYNGLELPQFVSWRSLQGMKINFEISTREDCGEMFHTETDSEETSFMMQLSMEPINAVEMTIAHRARCQTVVYCLETWILMVSWCRRGSMSRFGYYRMRAWAHMTLCCGSMQMIICLIGQGK